MIYGYRFRPPNGEVRVDISGGTNVGGLIGRHEDQYIPGDEYTDHPDHTPTSIKSFKVTGKVKGKKNVGGLIGYETGQNIKDSYFTGKVTGGENTGGLIGYKTNGAAISGTVLRSFAKGTVSGKTNTGGLIGRIDNKYDVKVQKSYYAGTVKGSSGTGGVIGYARPEKSNFEFSDSYVAGSVKGKTDTGGVVGVMDDSVLRIATLRGAYVSCTLSGAAAGKGAAFGRRVFDYQTKITDFYYDKGRAKTSRTGIVAYTGSPGNYSKPTAVTTGDIERGKLKGLDYKKIWLKKKPKGKKGWLPQLRVFAKSKSKTVKSASLAGVKTAAWYKVTYAGNGGKTASGKTTATQYVRYDRLKKTRPPAFVRPGYVATGVTSKNPKKLSKPLKNDKTKVKVKWESKGAYVPATVTFMAYRECRTARRI
jgi:hypothetical protein